MEFFESSDITLSYPPYALDCNSGVWLHCGHQKIAEGEMAMGSFTLRVLLQAKEQQKAGTAGHEVEFKVTLPHIE